MGRSKKRSKGSKSSSSKKIPEPKVEIVEDKEEIAEVEVKSNKKRKKIFDKNAVKESRVKIENDPDEPSEDEDQGQVDEEPDAGKEEEKTDDRVEKDQKQEDDDSEVDEEEESEEEEPEDEETEDEEDEDQEDEEDQEEDDEDSDDNEEEENEGEEEPVQEEESEEDEPEDEEENEETDDRVEKDQEPEEDDSEVDEEEQEELEDDSEEPEDEKPEEADTEDEESDVEEETDDQVKEDQEQEEDDSEVDEEEQEEPEDDEEESDQEEEDEDSDDDEEEDQEEESEDEEPEDEEEESDQEEDEESDEKDEDQEDVEDQEQEDEDQEDDDSEVDEEEEEPVQEEESEDEEPEDEEEESDQEEDEESDEKDEDQEDEEPEDDEEEDSDLDDGEAGIEEYVDEKPARGENVWNAVEWDDLLPPTDENVFTHGTIESVLKEVVETAWVDGVITDDEMALLNVLKSKLDIDDDTFNSILERSRPEIQIEDDEEPEDEDSEDDEEEEDEDYEDGEDDEEEDLSEDVMDGIKLDNLDIDEELEYLEGMVGPGPALPPGEEEKRSPERPKGPVKIEFEEDFQETPPEIRQTAPQPTGSSGMDYNPPPPPPPPPQAPSQNQGPGMITFTSSVRGNDAPLGRSFDLNKTPEPKAQQKTIQKRCGSCNALIRLQPSGGKDRCPICGARIGGVTEVSAALRSILDQGKIAFKGGNLSTAKELYGIALKQSPDNKEAKFFLMKLNRAGNGGPKSAAGSRSTSLDSRDLSNISSGVARLDQMIGGGMNVGSQMLIKGPPYSGKDILLDHLMASALRSGFPVIYVSSNRAMKDVMKGIVKQIPDFKKFNQSRRVRMYDLFSKHKGEQVLKEGHRIFNIEVKADFKRFQADLVMVQESLVQEYGGGVMIINSLSPLITQVDQNDLMKFLQVLIARSKGYRFTNIMDLASGIHHETIVNSVEYLMDGTVELREKDSRFSLRLRGFRQNTLTKDWVDYNFSESAFNLVGSFNEERIV